MKIKWINEIVQYILSFSRFATLNIVHKKRTLKPTNKTSNIIWKNFTLFTSKWTFLIEFDWKLCLVHKFESNCHKLKFFVISNWNWNWIEFFMCFYAQCFHNLYNISFYFLFFFVHWRRSMERKTEPNDANTSTDFHGLNQNQHIFHPFIQSKESDDSALQTFSCFTLFCCCCVTHKWVKDDKSFAICHHDCEPATDFPHFPEHGQKRTQKTNANNK